MAKKAQVKKSSKRGRPARPANLPSHLKMDGKPKKGYTKSGKKSSSVLKEEAKKRQIRAKNGPKDKKKSDAMKKYWKKISAAEREKRAARMWKKRRKLYSPKGFTKRGEKALAHGKGGWKGDSKRHSAAMKESWASGKRKPRKTKK